MKVVVLMGGVSSEREVSLVSGRAVAEALREKGHEVMEKDLREELDTTRTGPSADGNRALAEFVVDPAVAACDVVFIALHGGAGEDGTVQAIFDLTGKPYTGSGMLSSALCMDKILSKRVFEQAGIPTPGWRGVERADVSSVRTAIAELGGLPVVTKPRNQGSTVGVSIIKEESGITSAVEESLKYSSDILVEAYVPGREITVGLLGTRALPVVEIAPQSGFYDYECKYTKGKSKYIVPAEIPQALAEEAQRIALTAYRVTGCRDFSRVDFRLSPEGKIGCLEVNTIPGMTGTSLVPMAARAAGLDFPGLVDEICRLALSRRRVTAAARTG
ncbi:MAG: D-alanine--D-alanine ligase [Candidatus Eisenbacteria bacterium]